MKITRKILRQWRACYTAARIAALVPEDGLTPMEVAELDIPAEDRLWVLLREEIIPSRDLRLLACDWAEAACAAAGWQDQRSLEAIAVARRFACGEAAEAELVAAWSAALVAALAAAAAPAPARLAAWSTRLAAAPARLAEWSAAAAAEARSAAELLADVVRVLKQIDKAREEPAK